MNIRRLQRESDREQLARRTLMEIFYKFLHVQSDAEHPSSSSAPVLPPLTEFKKLGSIALLMKSKDCPDRLSVEKAMNDADSALRTTISQEIFQWVVRSSGLCSTLTLRVKATLRIGPFCLEAPGCLRDARQSAKCLLPVRLVRVTSP